MKRVATLGIPNLMRQITRLYRNVERLAQAQNALEVSALAGVFRSEYTPALDLDLVGIALEHFVSKSGYEGDTVYFLEETTKRWYTYTQARPVFYEKEQSLYNYGGQRYTQETPWGLPVPFQELAVCQFHLEHAKSDSRGRLSSSKETKGRLIRERDSKTRLPHSFWESGTIATLHSYFRKCFVQPEKPARRRQTIPAKKRLHRQSW